MPWPIIDEFGPNSTIPNRMVPGTGWQQGNGGWMPPNTGFFTPNNQGSMTDSIANFLSGGASGDAQHFYNSAGNAFGGIATPSIDSMKIKLNQLVQQGTITPEMAQTFLQDPSVLNNYSDDPRLRDAQMKALSNLSGVVDTNGLDAQAKNALYQLNNANATQERGQREAILQNANARGIGGSGLELASVLNNQQGSANRQAGQGFQAASDANARKMQAINDLATQGGNVRSQDFSQAAQKAAAQNAINQFNTMNQQGVENMNTGWRNQAQAQNLAEKQRIADTNTNLQNQQNVFNKGLGQQNFQNQLGLATGFSNAQLGAGNLAQGQANANTGIWSGLGNLAGGILSDENAKTEVTKFNPKKFMENLPGVSFKYKDPSNGKGRMSGVMAQDVEKGYKPAVMSTPKGKAISIHKVGGPMLASLGDLHRRLSKLEGK